MTKSEKFVYNLSQIAFLDLWSHPNPIGKKKGKELCDVLVVCGADIIVISVKHIEVPGKGNPELEDQRWNKRAIDDSVKQIYGAERILELKEKVQLKDSDIFIELPSKESRVIHRIAVAVGRGKRHSLKYGDFGKGFVHVFDEETIHSVLTELDTITDFINYLKAKEKLITSGTYPIYTTENQLLSWYILSNKSFEEIENQNVVVFEDDFWKEMKSDQLYLQLKESQKVSYLWDEIIDTFTQDHLNNQLLIPIERNNLDKSIRLMAMESRFGRQVLSEIILDFIGFKNDIKTESRITLSVTNPNVIYVLLLREPNSNIREQIVQELMLRCHAAREVLGKGDFVIGLGVGAFKSQGYSYDMCSIDTRKWDESDQIAAQGIIRELGFFKNAIKYDRTLNEPAPH
jgi:hypothetical protein